MKTARLPQSGGRAGYFLLAVLGEDLHLIQVRVGPERRVRVAGEAIAEEITRRGVLADAFGAGGRTGPPILVAGENHRRDLRGGGLLAHVVEPIDVLGRLVEGLAQKESFAHRGLCGDGRARDEPGGFLDGHVVQERELPIGRTGRRGEGEECNESRDEHETDEQSLHSFVPPSFRKP